MIDQALHPPVFHTESYCIFRVHRKQWIQALHPRNSIQGAASTQWLAAVIPIGEFRPCLVSARHTHMVRNARALCVPQHGWQQGGPQVRVGKHQVEGSASVPTCSVLMLKVCSHVACYSPLAAARGGE